MNGKHLINNKSYESISEMVYFFYFDIWFNKLNETIKMVKLRHHIIFDIENFRFIDIDTKKVVKHFLVCSGETYPTKK